MKRIIATLLLGCTTIFLGGCELRELVVCEYEAKGIVKVPEPGPSMAEIKSPALQPLYDLLAAVLPTMGQSRRKAMEEKINYEEWRVFRPLRLKFTKSEKSEAAP